MGQDPGFIQNLPGAWLMPLQSLLRASLPTHGCTGQGSSSRRIWGWIYLLSYPWHPRTRKISKTAAIVCPYMRRPLSQQPPCLHPPLQSRAPPGQSTPTPRHEPQEDKSYFTRITLDARTPLIPPRPTQPGGFRGGAATILLWAPGMDGTTPAPRGDELRLDTLHQLFGAGGAF